MITAEEAKKQSIKNKKQNNKLQEAIKYTDQNIEKAISNGERECVMAWIGTGADPYDVKIHYEERGFKVGQFKPPQLTYYLRW